MSAARASKWETRTLVARWGAKASALLLGLVVWLLVFEFVVCVAVKEPLLPRFVMDAGYGVRANQPNVKTRHYYPKDYDITVTTNSAGMRGSREYSLHQPDGVNRIMTLGDSMVFGFGAEDDEVLSAVLEDSLNAGASGEKRFEVLNPSVSGFGQAELLVTYREWAREYGAETVVLFYYNNDVANNLVSQLFELDGENSIRRTDNVYLPGVKAREVLYGLPPIRWLFVNSQAWNFVRNRLSAMVQKSLLENQELESFQTDDPEAVALTNGILKQFILDIQAAGADPILVIIPSNSIESNFSMATESVTTMGAQLVDGREFLKTEDYFTYDTHIRPSGHRKIAAQLDKLLAKP